MKKSQIFTKTGLSNGFLDKNESLTRSNTNTNIEAATG